MDCNIKKNNIRQLNQKIFFNLISDEDQDYINNIFLELIQINDFLEQENLLDIILFIMLYENKDCSCSEKIFLQRIKSKIIMDLLKNIDSNPIDFNSNINIITTYSNDDNINIENNCLEQDNRTSIQKFKELFLKENTYLTKEKHGIPFPNEGKTLIVKLKDNKTIPGSQYQLYVQIDSTGKVLEIVGEPLYIMADEEINELYEGLVGRIFHYEDVKKENEN